MLSFNRSSIALISSQLLLGALGLSIGSFIGLGQLLHSYSGKFYTNTSICHIDVSAVTYEEAANLITLQYIDPLMQQKLTFDYEGNKFSAPFEQFISSNNLSDVISQAIHSPIDLSLHNKLALLKGNESLSYDVNFDLDENAINDFIDDFTSKYTIEGKNADISITNKGHINILPSHNAISWDKKSIAVQIKAALNERLPRTISLETSKVITTPKITTDSLSSINSLISSYSTTFNPSTSNATNIRLAAKSISNTLLMPGDTFSFNDIVGDTTLEKGYAYAPVIANSRLIQGVGGGVCQVSSTLYNAVLLTGLTAAERQPHSKPSKYVPLGMDATIDWGSIDFKFQNTLEYPIYIVAYTEANKLYVDIYSNERLKSTSYVVTNEVYETIPSPINYVNDNSLPKGKTILLTSGTQGYKVKVIRKCYQNNTLIATNIVSTDLYMAAPTVYKKGTA